MRLKLACLTLVALILVIVIAEAQVENRPPNSRPPFRPRRPPPNLRIRNRNDGSNNNNNNNDNARPRPLPPNLRRPPLRPNLFRPRNPSLRRPPRPPPQPAPPQTPPPPPPSPPVIPQTEPNFINEPEEVITTTFVPEVLNVIPARPQTEPSPGPAVRTPSSPEPATRPVRLPPLGPSVPRPVRQPQNPSLSPNRNLPPVLLQGGDLVGFAVREDTPVASEIYTLKGQDPEGGPVVYTISGDYFTVNRESGVIKLREALDREKTDTLEVVITIQDSAFNLIPFRREIRILDVNDNAPEFIDSPYKFSIDETTQVGEVVFTSVALTDSDAGLNAKVDILCDGDTFACDTFDIRGQELSGGSYVALITLKKQLDFEQRSSYNMIIKAEDGGIPSKSSTANVFIEVNDIQDQQPVFLNEPYSATVQENIPLGSPIFDILVRDGDTGLPRNIDLSIVGDDEGFFFIDTSAGHDESGLLKAVLRSSNDNFIDRERQSVLNQGGLYQFQILAREILPNGQLSSQDKATTNVTVVITDQNDSIPTFNRANFTVAVPEDVSKDTPLPDLNIVVNDADVSKNAAFQLVIQDVLNSEGVFSVYPTNAIGRTPVIVRVENPHKLDYEHDDGRNFIFRVNALQGNEILSSAVVNVIVTDSNDNVPVFAEDNYEFSVNEDSVPGTSIGSILALDADSGRFGQVEYALKGFGAEKFRVDEITGEIFVASCGESIKYCLDFETQKSYALTYTATDGGNQVTTVGVSIHVVDVNDNFPLFELEEYLRIVKESALEFEPPLTIQASDIDGPTQGDGKVFYALHSINTDATVFSVDPMSGEVTFISPARSSDTEDGRYEMVVRATDGGNPPLFNDVKVTVRVGTTRNQKPRFRESALEAIVPENAQPGYKVLKVSAEDPDGESRLIKYSLNSGAKDNFAIDRNSGQISVSRDATLDIEQSGDTYEILVHAIDNGEPFKQTGEATLTIFIEDINDKKPKFDEESYTAYVGESTPVGQEVLSVMALDMDRNAKLEYSIVEPISARDKTGNVLNNRAAYDFSKAFGVDPQSGVIYLNEPLSHNSAAVIIVTVQVEDLGADEAYPDQIDTAEVSFYIQAYKADSPQFAQPWTPSEPTMTFEVDEQQPVGTVLFKLSARDPVTGLPITHFEKLPTSDPENLIDISPLTGEVINNQILDFEQRKDVVFQVRARAINSGVPGDQERVSDARIKVSLKDINDNSPIFERELYEAQIPENTLPLTDILRVKADDVDTGDFGRIRYSIDGEGNDAFHVDPESGDLSVKADPVTGRSNLDRERRDRYLLRLVATDMPQGGPGQRNTYTSVNVFVTDVNDSPPKFSQPQYSAVVPENSEPGTVVLQIHADDPDLGESGIVRYEFPEGSNEGDLFTIDAKTGEIFTAVKLTGKGRRAPYGLTVRALDQGESELFSDSEVYVTVGDVSSNDGVPTFIRPKEDEVAYINENATAGSKVFQVVARDPDDPATANGKLVYSLPDDGTIVRKLFQIDPVTGILTTRVKLDREEREEYTLILNVNDLGSPPQQTSRLLRVRVRDIDDHAPVFQRQRNSVPIEMAVEEELPLGSEIGRIRAVDEDKGENAFIGYAIVDGNDDKIFTIQPDPQDEYSGVITTQKRLDREYMGQHLLTIRCFRPYEANVKNSPKKYDPLKMDEIRVKVVVMDVDDNSPLFVEKNVTVGVRANAPIYTSIATVQATDPDADSNPVHYSLHNLTFFRQRTKTKEIIDDPIFIVDSVAGVVQTNQTLGRYVDGYFNIFLKASNGIHDTKKGDFALLRVS